MRRALAAALLLLLAGCGSPAPTLHPDVLIIAFSDGSRVIVRNPGATILGRLPAGSLAVALTGGDDIAEAYLVAPAAPGTVISSVQPSKGFALDPLATEPEPPLDAALLTAPQLTTFVGRKTVLVVLTDLTLTGYQHGSRIWSKKVGTHGVLARVGGRLFFGQLGTWSSVDVETGGLQRVRDGDCPGPGPVALVGGDVVWDCPGAFDARSGAVGPPVVFVDGAATMLAFSDGTVWRVQGGTTRRVFSGPPWVTPPVASLDGSRLYVPLAKGVDQVDVGTGRRQPFTSAAGVDPSVALSRDGNFLYALAGGVLRTFRLDTGGQLASISVGGVAIERVVGG